MAQSNGFFCITCFYFLALKGCLRIHEYRTFRSPSTGQTLLRPPRHSSWVSPPLFCRRRMHKKYLAPLGKEGKGKRTSGAGERKNVPRYVSTYISFLSQVWRWAMGRRRHRSPPLRATSTRTEERGLSRRRLFHQMMPMRTTGKEKRPPGWTRPWSCTSCASHWRESSWP